MAPTDQKTKNKRFIAKQGNWRKSRNNVQGVNKKRKWVPERKVFEGSVKEGQGFALKRKQKVKYEYSKLLQKEKKKYPESKPLYKDEYPEHLKHLYMAEAEKLKTEAWTNRMNRSKCRMKGQEKGEESGGNDDDAAADPEVAGGSDLTDSAAGNPEPTAASQNESFQADWETQSNTAFIISSSSLPMSNRMRKKLQKKTSYQKTKEEFETIREKRKNKKEEYVKNKQRREEAIQKYKEKKLETFQMLSKKTKKGQPNLNLQMEYLLQKIQGTEK